MKVWIQTFGCQMNVNDTEKMYRLLSKLDYTATHKPDDADLILVNTCTIREKAEHKVFSSLGRLKRFKDARASVRIGVAGCLAQMLGDTIQKRAPYVDFVVGTFALAKLPTIMQALDNSQAMQQVNVGQSEGGEFDFLPLQEGDLLPTGDRPAANGVVRHVTVQNGCNKNCSYCIVPTVRGREVSRPWREIVDEVRALTDHGVREVILVGQTVNSYGKGSEVDFADLLARLDRIDQLRRLRFVTSHPRDLGDKLIGVMANSRTVCEHLHLPVQSGSDLVLRRMYRGYTQKKYLDQIDRLRRAIPNLALTTDIIVAFPGESEEDFAQTLALMRAADFANAFAFVYSPRPYTKAAHWPAQIAEEIAKERLARLLEDQNTRTARHLRHLHGEDVEVLGEKSQANNLSELEGRTRTNWKVHIQKRSSQPHESIVGRLVPVRIEQTLGHSAQGVLV